MKCSHSVAVILSMATGLVQCHDQVPLSGETKLADYTCSHPPYKTHIVSRSPLVLYLEGFLTTDERAHLEQLATGHFEHSSVLSSSGSSSVHSVRTSQSTSIQRDSLVRCIEQRALDLQGFDTPESHLEPIQLVKYAPTERYHFHTDWFTAPEHTTAAHGGNRATSIFGYVKAENLTGGGTNFPMLDADAVRDEKWCSVIDCDEQYDSGVTFRAVEGNAIYWENLVTGAKGKGRVGDQRTLHAGLPVVRGEKIGMNIWTREGVVPSHLRGE